MGIARPQRSMLVARCHGVEGRIGVEEGEWLMLAWMNVKGDEKVRKKKDGTILPVSVLYTSHPSRPPPALPVSPLLSYLLLHAPLYRSLPSLKCSFSLTLFARRR
jgi:hypothetical protein